MRRSTAVALGILGVAACLALIRQNPARVGDETSVGTVIPVGFPIQPVGKSITLAHRPSQVVALKDGSGAFVLDESGLDLYDLPGLVLRQRLPINGGASMVGLALSPDQTQIAVSNAHATILIATLANGKLTWTKRLTVPTEAVKGDPYPCGLTFSADGSSIFACASRSNRLLQFNISTGAVLHDYPVDPAPFDVALTREGKATVSCWGRAPAKSEETADASGTPVPVDSRGIVSGASLDEINLVTARTASLPVGRQPANVAAVGDRILVPASNGDALEIESANGKLQNLDLADKFGKMCSPTWAGYSAARHEVAVTLGRNDRVAIYDEHSGRLKFNRTLATAWYPACVCATPSGWLVACLEGFGSRSGHNKGGGRNVYEYEGALSLIPYDAPASTLPEKTVELAPRPNTAPVPVPERLGEPSVFHHVVYVLKENRTYDQVFGDMSEGDGSPALCDYPRKVTPNQHKLADEFALLDNYYCNGILSADGHAWAMEGNATSYFERTFGGWTRSYPYGDDPLSVSSTGFIWNDVLSHNRTFRNYGEFDYAIIKPNDGWAAVYKDYLEGGTKHQFLPNIGVAALRPYSRVGYPGWNLDAPDQVRAKIFLDDLAKGVALQDFTIVYLPVDHTSGDAAGEPTPRACVADNDLAVGRVIEGLSQSQYWKDTVVFVNEDDPQAGYDHVDGHRSLCLVVSPYTKRKTVISQFYNQTSVLRTIEHILGIPPLNRLDAESPLMTDCFSNQPDFTPYQSSPNQVPLDEMNKGSGHHLSFSRPDLNDDQLMNQILWRAAHPGVAYPSISRSNQALAKRGLVVRHSLNRE